MASLMDNIEGVKRDFKAIKTSIENMGVEVPDGTPTRKYAQMINNIRMRSYSQYVGDGKNKTISICHNLGTEEIYVSVVEVLNKEIVVVDIEIVDDNNINLAFNFVPEENSYKVNILGFAAVIIESDKGGLETINVGSEVYEEVDGSITIPQYFFREANNQNERDRLKDLVNGMICYVSEDDVYYKYFEGEWDVFSSGTGGGVGGSETSKVILNCEVDKNLKVAINNDVVISFTYENSIKYTAAKMSLSVNSSVVMVDTINTGKNSVNVTEYLNKGSNTVEINVEDIYGAKNFLTFNIEVIELSVSSLFDSSQIFSSDIIFNYTPKGNVTKTLYVKIDGGIIGTENITVSGSSKKFTIPKQSHGEHILEVYISANLNGYDVISNVLKYNIICIEEGNNNPIISSSFNEVEVDQYTILSIPYMVYSPNALSSDVFLYVNNEVVSSISVDRTLQKWNLSNYPSGEVILKIQCGEVFKEFVLNVNAVEFDVVEKTDSLELYLSSTNRINDANKDVWEYNGIKAEFKDFNWSNDGWQVDDDGLNVLKVQGDARVIIPLKVFEGDFKNNGKAIECEFLVTDVTNYEDVVISCMSGDRGFEIGCKEAVFKSNEFEISTKFKDNERIRITFSIEKNKMANRLVYIYINGIISGIHQYTDNDVFNQVNPVNISIGNNNCTLYLYNIRVYDESLSTVEVLNNYIYDMNNPSYKLELYTKNNVYEDGEISYSKLLNQIPCMTIVGELPDVKGNKKYVDIYYENKQDPSKNFEDSNVKIDIQGTSSQYYPKKNYKFTLNNGYQLRDNSIEEIVYCLKADFMESSHCHNTGMAKIVHNMYDEKVPPQLEDDRVRTTVDGFPIALFYQEKKGEALQYFGIYNFNNDKSDVTTFGYSGDAESWEVCNNTSNRTLFKVSDYEKLNDKGEPEWQDDFEARYPDGNLDYSNLKVLTDWIAKWQVFADIPEESEEDKKIKNDTIALYKDEFKEHFNFHYMGVYYILTEIFAMTDSRAKNMFLSTWDKKVFYAVFYDMDTILGLNNQGDLVYEYNVEYHDILSEDNLLGSQAVFNGEDSLLWKNFEVAFASEIEELYNELRDSKKLTYEKVLEVLEGEQIALLCEAQYNEDAKYKYIDPLLSEGTNEYLSVAQGSRINHMKYWLYNRFNYMDSKYMASSYKSRYAVMRVNTPASWEGVKPDNVFNITNFAHQYATVKFGSYIVSKRAEAGVGIDISYEGVSFNNTETIIYGADRISSIGDLSNKYPGSIDVSKATQLTELIVGSGVEGYSNSNLLSLSVGNNKLLRKIDVRNCPNLTAPLDLKGCERIEEIYAKGSNITSVNFITKDSDGREYSSCSELRVLSIPDSITSLTLVNSKKLTNIDSDGYGKLNSLRVENSVINPFIIISKCENLDRVRLIGIDCQTSAKNVSGLMNMQGMDEDGLAIDIRDAVQGKITLVQCSKEMEEEFREYFKYVEFETITYTTSHTVQFLDGDGEVLYTQLVINNGEAGYNSDKIPTKTSTAEYDFKFIGWDRDMKPIISDTVINARFENIPRYYTIRFIDSSSNEILSSQYLRYGEMPEIPALPSDFNTWDKAISVVVKDMDYYTKYITYPSDLTIFSFSNTTLNGVKGFNCSLNKDAITPGLFIIPFQYNGLPVLSFNGNDSSEGDKSATTEVYIPDTIVSLGSYAFSGFTNLKNIVIPDGIESIGSSAFKNCKSISSISIPKGIETLSVTLFNNCENLIEIIIPDSVTEIKGSCFSNCSKLESIEIPESVEKIGTYCFSYCTSLKNVKIPSKVTTFSSGMFYTCSNLEEIEIPDGVTSLGEYCFSQCRKIKEIIIPDSVTEIKGSCFYYCTNLSEVILPKNITQLESSCFGNCSNLLSIEIPDGVTSLGNSCFSYCSKLSDITLPSNLVSLGKYCFYSCYKLEDIKILSQILEIGIYCFRNCSILKNVQIGDFGKEIIDTTLWEDNIFDNIQEYLEIYVTDESNIVGSPWGAVNAEIVYKQS
jgi:hypothetical protein